MSVPLPRVIDSGEKMPVCLVGERLTFLSKCYLRCKYTLGAAAIWDLGVEVQAMTQAESVICTLVLTGAHRCDISPVLRGTKWAEWYQDASPLHDDWDDELIINVPIASLQEAEEALRLTSGVKCSFGRQLCFVLRDEKTAYINLCDSGQAWQELSGSLY